MQYKVIAESEVDTKGAKKSYDIFANKHIKQTYAHELHTHTYYETLLLLEGNLIVQIGDTETVLLSQGDVIFIAPNVVHDTYLTANNANVMRSIVIKFSPMFLYPMETTQSDIDSLLMSPVYPNGYYLFRRDDPVTASIDPIMRNILNEKQKHEPGYELALRGLLTTLYIKLVRSCALQPEPVSHTDQKIDEASAQKLYQILTYLSQNYQYNVSMQEVADMCGMNYYRFSRFFNKTTNRNFNEYLLEMRLNCAQKKLLQSDKSVSEIAMECGFEYVSYFIQKFKHKNGITPREYQKKYRGFVPDFLSEASTEHTPDRAELP